MILDATQRRLEERARELAQRAEAPADGEQLALVTFTVAGVRCALEARHVIEALRLVHLTRLPGAEPPAYGVIAWRGEPLLVLDSRPLLGLSSGALNDLGRVLVLGGAHPVAGLLVDSVREFASVPAAAVMPRGDDQQAGTAPGIVRGITADAMLVLDVAPLIQQYA